MLDRGAIMGLFREKLLAATVEIAEEGVDAREMALALGEAFLNIAASCAPSREAYEQVTAEINRARWPVWEALHLN